MKKGIITFSINIMAVIIIVLLYFYFIFIPSQAIFKSEIEKEFISNMTIKSIVIDNSISRYIEGAKSITSRTMIRKKIVEFKKGKISIDELKNFTSPKYYEGIAALTNCVYATRYVNNTPITQIGNVDITNINCIISDTAKHQIITGFYYINSTSYVYVISPIKENKVILGYDIVYYSNNNVDKQIKDENLDFEIFHYSNGNYISYNGGKVLQYSNSDLFYRNEQIIYQVKSKYTDSFFVFSMPEKLLFEELHYFQYSQIVVISLLIFIIILILFIIQRRAKFTFGKQKKKLEELVNHKTAELNNTVDKLKKAKEEIAKSEEKYSIVANYSRDWDYWIDVNGNFVYVSPSSKRITGYEPEEFYKDKTLLNKIIHPDDKESFFKHKHSLDKNGERNPIEFRIITRDNENHWIGHVCQEVIGSNNKLQGIRVSNRIITETKKAEQTLKESKKQLQELNSTKDKFFSIIAHDLKSPYNTMLGFSKLLIENFDKYDALQQKKFVGFIQQGVQSTYKLLENLLLWSRSQTGTIEFRTEVDSLNLWVEETLILLSQSAENKSIQLINNIPDSINIKADKNMLLTILRNLVSNAIKFTSIGGEVSITAQATTNENNNYIELSVKDNGVGISKENLARLFKLSENVTTCGTQNETGTGLGLILAKEFIERHGGEIWVESEEGKGSTFIFTVPNPYSTDL